MSAIVELLDGAPVIPVIVVDDIDDALPIAAALAAGGLRAIEVTLRTACAEEAIRQIASERPDIVVGAGTVFDAAQSQAAIAAGARFLVSPGTTPALLDALHDAGVPFLAGAATASDVVALLERGVTEAKLFPAKVLGGVAALKALSGPFPEMRFCPTGGIDAASAPDYLALDNVLCVGGSWMLPAASIEAGDWPQIEELARAAAALPRPAGLTAARS